MIVPDDSLSRRIAATITAYYAATRAMDVEAWVGAFAANAVAFNPVGATPTAGHHGLRELWASLSCSLDHLGLSEDCVFVADGAAAVKWSGHGVGWTGRPVVFEGIDVFEIDDHGKISTLWSYWDPAVLRSQLRQQTASRADGNGTEVR